MTFPTFIVVMCIILNGCAVPTAETRTTAEPTLYTNTQKTELLYQLLEHIRQSKTAMSTHTFNVLIQHTVNLLKAPSISDKKIEIMPTPLKNTMNKKPYKKKRLHKHITPVYTSPLSIDDVKTIIMIALNIRAQDVIKLSKKLLW